MDVTKANRNIKDLKPNAQKALFMFLEICKYRKIDIFVTETHRSQERQNYLYDQGRREPYKSNKIVTWTTTSNHTGGMAWDIACNGNNLYDEKIISKAGEVAKLLGIEWGGIWKQKDTPHFQVNNEWKFNDVPRWQIDAVIDLCKSKHLEIDTWLPKIDKPLTAGEVFSIINKVVK